MTLEDIYQLAQDLVDDPELATPIRDALEDLGLTWVAWLVQSGILEKLAAEMCEIVGHNAHSLTPGLSTPQAEWCVKALAFGVQPVLIEVKLRPPERPPERRGRRRSSPPPTSPWEPPSLRLAIAMLEAFLPANAERRMTLGGRRYVDYQTNAVSARVILASSGVHAIFEAEHPDGIGCRVRFLDGGWLDDVLAVGPLRR